MPSQESGRDGHKLSYIGDIDVVSQYAYDYWPSVSERQVRALVKKLEKYGLQEHQIDILIDRFVYNKTIAEITDEHGFTSPGITFYLYKNAIAELKAKGFGFPKKKGLL